MQVLSTGGTSMLEKLKVFRYAWREPTIAIPNKHQVLSNWLTLSLTRAKTLDGDLRRALWNTFLDMMQTKACRTCPQNAAPVEFNSHVIRTLFEQLYIFNGDSEEKPCISLDVILRCCKEILTAENLAALFTTKMQNLMELCGILLEVFTYAQENSPSEDKLETILDVLLLATQLCLSHIHRFSSPQVQFSSFCSYILEPSYAFLYGSDVREYSSSLRKKYDELSNNVWQLLKLCLLPEFLQYGYKISIGSPDEKALLQNKVQVVLKFLTSLSAEFEGSETQQSWMLKFLPKYYSLFVASKCMEGNMWFDMLVFLTTKIMNIPIRQSTGEKIETQSTEDNLPEWLKKPEQMKDMLRCVNEMLEVIHNKRLYDIASDNDNDHVQLKWYTSLIKWLGNLNSRCATWYDCFTTLLLLNPTILTLARDQAMCLKSVIHDKNKDIETEKAKKTFVGTLTSTSLKLSKFPKLVKNLLKQLQAAPAERDDVTQPLCLPTALISNLEECFSKLVMTAVFELWEDFIQEIEQQGALFTTTIVEVFCVFLSNIQVSDFDLAQARSKRVEELMTQTWTRCVARLVSHCVSKKFSDVKLASCLQFIHAWGQLNLMLRYYAKYTGPQSEDCVKTKSALFIPQVFPASDWLEKLEKRVAKSTSNKVLYMKTCLLYQSLQTAHTMPVETAIEVNAKLDENLTTLLQAVAGNADDKAHWNGQVLTITDENAVVASWSLFYKHSHVLLSLLNEAQVQSITETAICLSLARKQDVTEERDGLFTLKSVGNAALRSEVWAENRTVQNCVLRSVWKSTETVVNDSSKKLKSPKKKKKGNKEQISQVFSLLGEISPDTAAVVRLVIGLLRESASNECVLEESQLTRLTHNMEILLEAPLEYLGDALSIDCILAILAILYLANSNGGKAGHIKLVESCMTVLHIVLHDLRAGAIPDDLDMTPVLSWLHGFMAGFFSEVSESTMKHYYAVIQRLLKLCTSSTESVKALNTFVDQVRPTGKSREAEELTLSTSVLTLQALSLVVEKYPEAKASYTTLSSAFLKRAKKKTNHHILDAFRIIIAFEKKHGQGQRLQDYVKHLDLLCSYALSAITNAIVYNTEEVKTCLKFLSFVCHNQLLGQTPDGFAKTAVTSLQQAIFRVIGQKGLVDTSQNDELREKEALLKDPVLNSFAKIVFSDESKSLHTDKSSANSKSKQEESAMEIDDDIGQKSLAKVISSSHSSHESTSEVTDNTSDMTEFEQDVYYTIVALMCESNDDEFRDILCSLMAPLDVKADSNATHLIGAIKVLKELVTVKLNSSQQRTLTKTVSATLLPVIDLVSSDCHVHKMAVTVQVLQYLSTVLVAGKVYLSGALVPNIFHACYVTPLTPEQSRTLPTEHYVMLYQALYDVLNAMMLNHMQLLANCIPQVLAAIKVLIVSIIERGNQQATPPYSPDVPKLAKCAHLVERLYALMQSHPNNFGKVSVYIIADYLQAIKKVTLLPLVKQTLLNGMEKVLAICDTHAIAQLHAQLDEGSKQIFNNMYHNFSKDHRYTFSTE